MIIAVVVVDSVVALKKKSTVCLSTHQRRKEKRTPTSTDFFLPHILERKDESNGYFERIADEKKLGPRKERTLLFLGVWI